jgi:lipopolysaccharide heptosyltransferase I
VNLTALRHQRFERILLIKPSAVGDVIHTLPVLAKLRARYPAAQIDWLLAPHIAELVRHHPALSNALLFARQDFNRLGRSVTATAGLLRLFRRIWQTRYDLALDLHGQFRSALFTLASRAPVRLGFDRPGWRHRRQVGSALSRGWKGTREGAWVAYTHRIPIPTLDVHAVDRYLWLGPILGLDDGPADFGVPIPAEARDHVETLLRQHGVLGRPYAVLVPGTLWPTKHWRLEGFAEVGRDLARQGIRVILAGSPKERPRCDEAACACPSAVNLAGQTTLSQLAALIDGAAICVTNDSGSMHLTVALGRPVVSVFGPTNPVWIGPYQRPYAVVQARVPCAPCYLRKLHQCRYEHQCMTSVSAAMVIERVRRTLATAA